MENYIINKEEAFSNLLSVEHYFLSLLQVLYTNKILNNVEMEKIQFQILELLKEKVGYYTRDESSSVRVEVAEQMMLSIYYTIGLFLKSTLTIKESINLIKEKDIRDLFLLGEDLLIGKVEACRRILNIVQKKQIKNNKLCLYRYNRLWDSTIF